MSHTAYSNTTTKADGCQVLFRKAVIYARYSSSNQTEESIEGQIEYCKRFAAKNGYMIVDEYIDRAISATTDKRPDFQRMISDAAAQTFQYVLVWKMDRFSRDMDDLFTYEIKLRREYNVHIISVTEPELTNDKTGIFRTIRAWQAQDYIDDLRQKTHRGLETRFEKGQFINNAAPLGYKIVDKRLTIDEDTASIVREIFKMRKESKTYDEIRAYLDAVHAVGNRGGNTWDNKSLRYLFANTAYVGEYRRKDMDGYQECPAIIDRETFDAVQTVAAHWRKRHRNHPDSVHDFFLTGKVVCPQCGNTMSGTTITDRRRKGEPIPYYYYRCQNCKPKRTIPAEKIEDIAIDLSLNLFSQREYFEMWCAAYAEAANEYKANASKEIKPLEARLNQVDKALDNFTKAIAKGVNLEAVVDNINSLQGEKAEIQELLRIKRKGIDTAFDPDKFLVDYLREAQAIGVSILMDEDEDEINRKFREFHNRSIHTEISNNVGNKTVERVIERIRRIVMYDDRVEIQLLTAGEVQTFCVRKDLGAYSHLKAKQSNSAFTIQSVSFEIGGKTISVAVNDNPKA